MRIKYFGSPFQKLYRPYLPLTFTNRSLTSLLPQTRNLNNKSIILLVSPSKPHQDIIDFLKKQDIQRAIIRNFWLVGSVLGNADLGTF